MTERLSRFAGKRQDTGPIDDIDKARAEAETSDNYRTTAASLRRAADNLLSLTVSAPAREVINKQFVNAIQEVNQDQDNGIVNPEAIRRRDDLDQADFSLVVSGGNVPQALKQIDGNISNVESLAGLVEDAAGEHYDVTKAKESNK